MKCMASQTLKVQYDNNVCLNEWISIHFTGVGGGIISCTVPSRVNTKSTRLLGLHSSLIYYLTQKQGFWRTDDCVLLEMSRILRCNKHREPSTMSASTSVWAEGRIKGYRNLKQQNRIVPETVKADNIRLWSTLICGGVCAAESSHLTRANSDHQQEQLRSGNCCWSVFMWVLYSISHIFNYISKCNSSFKWTLYCKNLILSAFHIIEHLRLEELLIGSKVISFLDSHTCCCFFFTPNDMK